MTIKDKLKNPQLREFIAKVEASGYDMSINHGIAKPLSAEMSEIETLHEALIDIDVRLESGKIEFLFSHDGDPTDDMGPTFNLYLATPSLAKRWHDLVYHKIMQSENLNIHIPATLLAAPEFLLCHGTSNKLWYLESGSY